MVGTVAGLAIDAAVIGLLVGSSLRSEPAPQVVKPAPAPAPIAAGGLRMQLPKGWARGGPSGVAGFENPLWLRDHGKSVRAAVELLPATSPTLLPTALGSDAPSPVRLRSGYDAWRYGITRPDGSEVVVYATPTTKGIVTVGCVRATRVGDLRTCAALASAVSVPGAIWLTPNDRAAFLSRLPTTVRDLRSARFEGVMALRAATRSRGQALAADRLARAHKAAGADLAPLAAADDELATATLSALTTTATAYAALADAARNRRLQPYAAARREVTEAEAGLRRQMTKVAAAIDRG